MPRYASKRWNTKPERRTMRLAYQLRRHPRIARHRRGILTASNDEEGTAKKITSIISRMRTYGYLAPIEDDDMYVLTPLVPHGARPRPRRPVARIRNHGRERIRRRPHHAGPDDRPMEDIEQDAFDFNTDDNRFDEEEH